MSEDTVLIQDAMGEKVSFVFTNFAYFIKHIHVKNYLSPFKKERRNVFLLWCEWILRKPYVMVFVAGWQVYTTNGNLFGRVCYSFYKRLAFSLSATIMHSSSCDFWWGNGNVDDEDV